MLALRGGKVGVSSEWWNMAISIQFPGYDFCCKTELTPPGELHDFALEEFLVDAIPGIDQIPRKWLWF